MFIRFVQPGWHTETERAVAGALQAVEAVQEHYQGAPSSDPETVVIVATPNDSLADVVRLVTEAMVKARRVRVEAPAA